MSDAHTIITALMTDQSAQGIDLIKGALEKRAEAEIQAFVTSFEYAAKDQEAIQNKEEPKEPDEAS